MAIRSGYVMGIEDLGFLVDISHVSKIAET